MSFWSWHFKHCSITFSFSTQSNYFTTVVDCWQSVSVKIRWGLWGESFQNRLGQDLDAGLTRRKTYRPFVSRVSLMFSARGKLVFIVGQNVLNWTSLNEKLSIRWSKQISKIILRASQFGQCLVLNDDTPVVLVSTEKHLFDPKRKDMLPAVY